MTDKQLEQSEFRFGIYKLEYEQAAQRYENIYKAIWQIFSYMAALAAAILTFAASNIPLIFAVLFALLPLMFWYLAIYLPMDFYGEQNRQNLAQIEMNINEIYLKDFENDPKKQLNHYSGFYNNKPKWRVKQAVQSFAYLTIAIIFLILIFSLFNISNKKTGAESKQIAIKLEPPVEILINDSQIQELKKENQLLLNKLDLIESLIRKNNLNLSNTKGDKLQN